MAQPPVHSHSERIGGGTKCTLILSLLRCPGTAWVHSQALARAQVGGTRPLQVLTVHNQTAESMGAGQCKL